MGDFLPPWINKCPWSPFIKVSALRRGDKANFFCCCCCCCCRCRTALASRLVFYLIWIHCLTNECNHLSSPRPQPNFFLLFLFFFFVAQGPRQHLVGRVRLSKGGPHGRRPAGPASARLQGGGQQHRVEGGRFCAPRA